ncbi:MAG: acyl-[ACP]--phospholipid O-acyltransferase [Bacteroidota bacterium]
MNQMQTPEYPWKRSFWSLMTTQFQGAFSDNAHKILVLYLILGMGLSQHERDLFVPGVQFLFALPFILFSMTGGYLADRYSKRSVTIGTKLLEICVMLFATAALVLANVWMMLTAVFLMSVQSALFGPSKYGLLPELLPEKRLSWGNGVIELYTILAIIAGTVGGGLLSETFRGNHQWSGMILVALACLGLVISLGINRVPVADPARRFQYNFISDLVAQVRKMRRDRVLFLALLGSTYFWGLGGFLQSTILIYGNDVLHLSEAQNSYLAGALALGVGLGSFAAGHLSGKKIEYGLIPLGSIGITVFAGLMFVPGLSFLRVAVHLGMLGFFSGFFIVPINALLQHRPAREDKGGVLAAANLLSFVGVAAAAAVFYLLTAVARFTPPTIFLISSLATVAATAYVVFLLPDALLRLLLWLYTHSFYRIRVEGRDNIPDKGGALFVSNHMSLIDALLLLASTDRFVRFIMYKGIYDMPIVRPFARVIRAIPISSQLRPREMIRALNEASAAIREGDVVCIFAEGQITRIGQLLPFRRGLTRIMKDVEAPIIPVNLDGVWGSIFSYERGRFFWKFPRHPLSPVTVSFGKPMDSQSAPFDVRQAVQELNTDSWHHRKRGMNLLHRLFVRTARLHPLRFAMGDARVPRMRFGSALMRCVYLARRLGPVWQGQAMVGLLLPPSIAGALVNLSALAMGKVPVNLNYTASSETIASCAAQCGIQTVVTSRAFLEKVHLTVPGKTILLEDLAGHPRTGEKLLAMVLAWLVPVPLLERALGRGRAVSLDDLATVIFSSGSTGDPKGVMLTHYNIVSNIEQMGQTFAFHKSDRILGILPFFHSFGFTATIMVPTALGVGVVYHPNPLDAQVIGDLVEKYRVTFLVATPTFLQAYLRRVEPEQFGSLQFIMAGAEKLPERLAVAFEDKFGIRPLEGYGCTECAPVVTVNTHDFRAAGFRQVGAKRGKIGHPLPGLSVRIVDPTTMLPLPVGQSGLLLVKGPNVMKGYLGRPEKTREVMHNGWYSTGDIASLDEDGFLQITDRLTRFSKIGGEMVPHIKVEERLHEIVGSTEQVFAVAGVPDATKGERLVVLTTLPDSDIRDCSARLSQSGLPNLWIPRPDQFFHIEKLPYLGTGKLDLKRVKELAVLVSSAGRGST